MCRLFLMTIALLMIFFGISSLYMMPKLIQQKIEQRIQLKIGTKTFERFTNVPIPLTVKFYLFNVTNSEAVLAGLERPKFQEVGPFMYKQWRRREIVDFEDYNRRLRYREIKTFYPMYKPNEQRQAIDNQNQRHNSDHMSQQEQLANSPVANMKTSHSTNNLQTQGISTNEHQMLDPHNINITIINLPLLSALTKLAQLDDGSIKKTLAARVASKLIEDGRDKILITKPANQLLFDGYKVDFMESARDLVSGTFGFNFDSPLPKNMFGFFFGKNGTWNRKENGELTVFTGRNDSMNDFMLVDNWNDQRQLTVWPNNTIAGDRCNQIKGTDGSQFHPGVNKDQVLSIFSPMVCTSLFIKYKEDTSARDIPLLRYTTPAELFAAPKKNPSNACYCTIPSQRNLLETKSYNLQQQTRSINDSRCYLDGLMDLSLCQRGAPIAASSPHFYNADPMLAMAAGLTPKQHLHETYIDIEPMTGAVMRAASRAQLNAYIEQAALDVVEPEIIGHMTPMIAPLLWLEEAAEIDEKSSKEFKSQLLYTVQKARRAFIYGIVGGIIIALAVSLQYWYVTCYKPLGSSSAKSRTTTRSKSRIRGEQRRANIRLGAGARRSNLAAKSGKTIKLDETNLLPVTDDSRSNSAATVAVGAAAILGASSVGSQGIWGRKNRNARQVAAADRRAGFEQDDEESSKLQLVDWDNATATTTGSGASSSAHLSQEDTADRCDMEQKGENDDDDLTRPSTSSGGSSYL